MTTIKGYKGFDKDFKCRDFQYEVGKEYKHEKKIELCDSGFHFCENPFDVFGYYPPNQSRFAEVEGIETSDETSDDSKRVAKKLKIGSELSLHSLIDFGVKFILDKVDFKNANESNTGYKSASTNTGYQSASTNTGEEGCAISLGIEGKAKGALGCWLTIAEWKEIKNRWHRIDVQTKIVDGKKIKADTFYILKDGKFIEEK